MKTISNIVKAVSTSLVLSLALILVVSTPSMAVTADRMTNEQPKTITVEQGSESSAQACTRFTTLASTTSLRLAERLSAMKLDFQKRLSNITSRHDAIDQKVATFRTSLGDKFDIKVAELKDKDGLTDAKLTAIDTYHQAVKTAEVTREKAVDSARTTYRAAFAKEVTDQQAKLSEAAAAFQTSVNTAIATAKTNCGNSTAAAALKTSIKAARDVFQSSRKADAAKSSIKQLAATRAEAVKAADAEFKKSVEAYTKTLEAIL
jgi:hypothetical protein